MFLILLLITLASIVVLAKIHKPFRFYCFSFFLPQLFDRPRLAKLLGIRYETDTEWETTREESKVYIPGFIAALLRIFIGMDFILPDDVRKKFQALQSLYAKNMNMEKYFDELDGKTISLAEFEDFLSRNVIQETNQVFQIISDEKCKWLIIHSRELRTIVSALTISMWDGMKTAIAKFHHVVKMSLILRSAPPETRIMLIAPQLALIHNFSKMIINKNGDMSAVKPYDFLEPVSRFFVAETKCKDGSVDLVFVIRHFDKRNNVNNRAFGPFGLQCPGALYTFKFIQDVTKFLKSLIIQVGGDPPIFKGGRFRNMINKDKILLTINKNKNWVPDVDNDAPIQEASCPFSQAQGSCPM